MTGQDEGAAIMKFYCRTGGSSAFIESPPSQGPADLQDVSTQPVQCDPTVIFLIARRVWLCPNWLSCAIIETCLNVRLI
ncbi:hypothetical protein AS156_35390 [Bradyrhizobium macuxiense]|uniref:Uncharacterized protein n=1 Tax=Bradyrhizobium macuxiense TaxID=1755647 RepID=A0A109JZV4_9BRAD|nr:hypothetical protein AS156_35390 [Bradyrhizobium macuxiense]